MFGQWIRFSVVGCALMSAHVVLASAIVGTPGAVSWDEVTQPLNVKLMSEHAQADWDVPSMIDPLKMVQPHMGPDGMGKSLGLEEACRYRQFVLITSDTSCPFSLQSLEAIRCFTTPESSGGTTGFNSVHRSVSLPASQGHENTGPINQSATVRMTTLKIR